MLAPPLTPLLARSMSPPIIHLRAETKPHEERSALTPTTTTALLAAGFTVNVERSTQSIFRDEEYSAVGATLVPTGSWPSAPEDHIILGLKELPEEDFPLKHTHVQFAHCFKGQANWREVLSRFSNGGGTLYDLEFLTDATGRRVAAFGYHAGYAGAAVALMVWEWQLEHHGKNDQNHSHDIHGAKQFPALKSYQNESSLIQDVRARLKSGIQKSADQKVPRAIVIGALGRCGRGAVDLFRAAGLPAENLLEWDMKETAPGGPFKEIVESDIFINCIYLMDKIPPFVDSQSLDSPSRKLSVVCDVSCDPSSPLNPLPIYSAATTFSHPTVSVPVSRDPPLSVIAVDHLPSLLPREASESFSKQLLPSLLELGHRKENEVWTRAEKVFRERVEEL